MTSVDPLASLGAKGYDCMIDYSNVRSTNKFTK